MEAVSRSVGGAFPEWEGGGGVCFKAGSGWGAGLKKT